MFVIAIAKLLGGPGDAPVLLAFASGLTGTLILAGFWTPLAASCQAILEGVLGFTGQAFEWTHLVHAMIGLSLVMLGPGSWSIDARLYGRKRIDLKR